tara:strand:- start:36 stop:530 length:495 start_codon:yes stop_codon:yes gene_type:complete
MKKTDQEEFNEVVFESIEGLRDALKTGSASRDVLLKIIKFEGTRLDSLDNKVDILMSERAEAATQIKEDDVWYNKESKKAILDDIADTTITPIALIELGFEEMYQDVDYGEPGYIYYSHEIKGVGFYSVDTECFDFHVKLDNSDYEIHNLSKLRDLILSLNEIS